MFVCVTYFSCQSVTSTAFEHVHSEDLSSRFQSNHLRLAGAVGNAVAWTPINVRFQRGEAANGDHRDNACGFPHATAEICKEERQKRAKRLCVTLCEAHSILQSDGSVPRRSMVGRMDCKRVSACGCLRHGMMVEPLRDCHGDFCWHNISASLSILRNS